MIIDPRLISMTDSNAPYNTIFRDTGNLPVDNISCPQSERINRVLIPLLSDYAEQKSHFTIVKCRDALLAEASITTISKHYLYKFIAKRLKTWIEQGFAIEVGIQGKKRKVFQMLCPPTSPRAANRTATLSAPPLLPEATKTEMPFTSSQDQAPAPAPAPATEPEFTDEDKRSLKELARQQLITLEESELMIECFDFLLNEKPKWCHPLHHYRAQAAARAIRAKAYHKAFLTLSEQPTTEGDT
ncbi:hypothetical protein [Cobetia crustatorum]|uniref:hypothetical protein n=1 Tax=Cobetia crustatorum TaxID=553385 RepID=UPI00146F9931|nr:hypothetical protein [Cobetia crustatorum]